MESIPWYAWIVLVSIVVAGIVQLARLPRGGGSQAEPELRARVIALEERIQRLEGR